MPRPLSPCGTFSAYQRHTRKGEPVDEKCDAGAKKYWAERRRATRPTRAPDPPATPAPTTRCPFCGEREVVEYPADGVAVKMALVRHMGKPENARCAAEVRKIQSRASSSSSA